MSDEDIYFHVGDDVVGSFSNRAEKQRERREIRRCDALAPYLYFDDSFADFIKRIVKEKSPTVEAMGKASFKVVTCLQNLCIAAGLDRITKCLAAYLLDVKQMGVDNVFHPTLIKDIFMFLRDFIRSESESETWGNLVIGMDLVEDGPDIRRLTPNGKLNTQRKKTPRDSMGILSGLERRAISYRCVFLPIKDIVEPLCNSHATIVKTLASAIIEADTIFFPDGYRGKSGSTLINMLKGTVNESELIDRPTKRKLTNLLDNDMVETIIQILNVEKLYDLLNTILKTKAGSANDILSTPAFEEATNYVSDLYIIYKENTKVSEALETLATSSSDLLANLDSNSIIGKPDVFPFPCPEDKDVWVTNEVLARLDRGKGAYAIGEDSYDFSHYPEFVAAYCSKHPNNENIPLPNISGTVSFSALSKLTPNEFNRHKKTMLELFGCSKSVLYALNNGILSEEVQNIVTSMESGVKVALDTSTHKCGDITSHHMKIYSAMRALAQATLAIEQNRPLLNDDDRIWAFNYFKLKFPEIRRKPTQIMEIEKLNEEMIEYLKTLGTKMVSNLMMRLPS